MVGFGDYKGVFMTIYKIQEDFETSFAYATKEGLIEIANNDREVDGEIRPECKNIEDAIELLKDKGFNIETCEGEFTKNTLAIYD